MGKGKSLAAEWSFIERGNEKKGSNTSAAFSVSMGGKGVRTWSSAAEMTGGGKGSNTRNGI